jgi:alpha-beta hydrolase superfamily lysophospholipase
MPSFTDGRGVAVTYYQYPVPSARAVVQIAHGIGEHAGRYAHVAQALNDAGYAVYANDHRGHGATGRAQWGDDPKKLGKLGPGGLRATVADLRQLSGIIRAENRGVPLVLLGHSWGSLMAQQIVNAHAGDYDGVVLTGTAYRMLGSMRSGNFNARFKGPGATGFEWLSRDVDMLATHLGDPLTFEADVIGKFGLIDAMRLLGRPARHLERDVPLLIMVGSDDPLGGERSVVKLANAYRARSGLTDVTAHIYRDARHEIFNETNRAEVLGDLVTWLRGHVG